MSIMLISERKEGKKHSHEKLLALLVNLRKELFENYTVLFGSFLKNKPVSEAHVQHHMKKENKNK